jgi:hypothetical protein
MITFWLKKPEVRAMTKTGGCLCGAVRYEVHGPLRPVVVCHCTQCRKQTGHFLAATGCLREHLVLTRADGLKWYRSSAIAQRGFCQECGSVLFWQADAAAHTSITPGSLDGTSGLETAVHICVAYKGDYYAIEPDVPQVPGVEFSVPVPGAP